MQGLNSRKEVDFVEAMEDAAPVVTELLAGESTTLEEQAQEEAHHEASFDSLLDGEQPQDETQELESVEAEKSSSAPAAQSPNQGNWFKRWADKFIDMIDE